MIGAYLAMSLALTCFTCAVRGWRFPLSSSRRSPHDPGVDAEPAGRPVAIATGTHSQALSGKTAVLIGEKADFRRATIHISSPNHSEARTSALPPVTDARATTQNIGDRSVTDRSDAAVRPFAPVSIDPRLPLALRDKDRPLRGRDILVRQLVVRLQPPHDRASTTETTNRVDNDIRRAVLLHGPAGCGKTSIAEQVAYEAAEARVDVWWVDAVDQASVDASMNTVAGLVGAPEQDQGERTSAADALWRSLRSRDRPWLLVADGVDDPALLTVSGQNLAAGTGWVRPLASGPGLVLVTSRDSAPSRWGDWWDRQLVGGLEPEDGALVLQDYTAERAGTKSDAQALSTRLSGLALALKLAGAYLAVTSKGRYPDPGPATFVDYKKALDNDLLYHLPSDEQNIVRIWQLSIELLERRGLGHARSLLRLLCCLADAPVPDQLVLDPAVLAVSGLFNGLDGTSLQLTVDSLADLRLVDLTQPVPSVGPDEQMGRAWKPALVTIHPLIRHAIRLVEPGPESVGAYLILAARLLCAATQHCRDPDDDLRSWSSWHALAPHCTHLLHTLSQRAEADISPGAFHQAALAAYGTAEYLYLSGADEQAEAEFKIILEILRKLPDDHLNEILKIRTNLAGITRDRPDSQQLDQAELELREIYAKQQRLLADDQTDPTGMLRRLGRVGWDTPEGLALLKTEWDISVTRPILDMLDTYQGLAITLAYKDNNSSEAKAIYKSAYEALKRLLGDDHSKTLVSRTGLAARLFYEGRLEEAEREFRAIYDTARQSPSMGPDDPQTLGSQWWVARTLYDLGRLEEAEREFRALCAASARVLGHEHSLTKGDRWWLACVLLDLGRKLTDPTNPEPRIKEGAATMAAEDDTKRELEQALACFQEALGLIDGDQNPGFYGVILHDIAATHQARGDRQQAIAAYREAVTYKRNRLPDGANDLATTMEALCDFLIDGAELGEARAVLDQLNDVLPQIADSAERARHVHSAGWAYERLANLGLEDGYSTALRVYTEALGFLDGDQNPGFYGVILHDIGDVYRARGDRQQAAAAYREAVTYKRKRLPDRARDLAITMEALSDLLIESDELGEARAVLDQLSEVLPQIADSAGEPATHILQAEAISCWPTWAKKRRTGSPQIIQKCPGAGQQ